MSAFQEMILRAAQSGRLQNIVLRPSRLVAPVLADSAQIDESGIVGDHGRPGKRAVTLIQAEHLAVIGAMLGDGAVDPAVARRNLVVAGVNLNALKGRQVRVGGAVLKITGICAPCSRMEQALGPGGYSAMRGHGGWCADVVSGGKIALSDSVSPMSGTV